MDGNLEYLQTNLSGSNTIIGNTDIKITTDSDAILKISLTDTVVTESDPFEGDTITTTQTKQFNSTIGTSEFTSSFRHANLVSVYSSSFGESTFTSLGIGYTFASSSYDGSPLGGSPIITKFIGSQVGGPLEVYSDTTSIIPIGQNNAFFIDISSAGYGNSLNSVGSGSIALRKTTNKLSPGSSTTDSHLYIDGNQPGVNIYSTEEQAFNVYGKSLSGVFPPPPRPTLFQVNQSGSVSIPQTASAEPTWSGSDGEIIPATVGGSYYLYMWMNGAWRSGSFS